MNVGEWGVVIAAGGRTEPDLLRETGVHEKALVEFAGKPAVAYVLDACRDAGLLHICVVARDEVANRISLRTGERLAPPGDSSIASSRNGIDALDGFESLLFLPCDVPLISGGAISSFIAGCEQRVARDRRWLAGSLTQKSALLKEFPGVPARFIRLREGRFVANSLFAASREAFRHASAKLEAQSKNRKSQFKAALGLGAINLLKYLFGQVSVSQAEAILSRFFDADVYIASKAAPEGALDFDDVADYRHLTELIMRRG